MGIGVTTLIGAVILGGVFGSASATVESINDEVMTVSIEVEVIDPGEAVVAHLSFEEDELTLPLLDRGNGSFGLRTELQRKNYAVVFETLGEDGQSSEPTTLTRLGADLGTPAGGRTSTTSDEEGLSRDSQRLLWLAVALAAASLSLLAFWVLGSRDDEPDADVEDGDLPGEEE